MAKKESTKKKPEVVPGENGLTGQEPIVVIEEAEVIELPMELVEIKQEYGLSVPDDTVNKHVLTYAPYFKQLVDLESELTDLLTKEITPETANEAASLRKKYMKIRTGSDDQKKEDKKHINAEGKFLDTVFNRIKAGAETKEAKCKEIEQHLEKLETQRLEALKAERKAVLAALDYDTDFLTVEDMSEESFNKLVTKATETFNAMKAKTEQDQKDEADKEAKRQRKTDRVNDLAKVGLFFNSDTEFYEGKLGRVSLSVVESWEDDDFNKTFSLIETAFENEAQAEADRIAEEKAKAERITNRINAITRLGLTYDTVLETYTGFGQSIALEYVKTAEAQDFTDVFNTAKSVVDKKKSEEKKAEEERARKEKETKAENERLRKIEEDRVKKEKEAKDKEESEKKAAALAPDVDKLRALYVLVKTIQVPEMKTAEGKAAISRIKEGFDIVLKGIVDEAKKLK